MSDRWRNFTQLDSQGPFIYFLYTADRGEVCRANNWTMFIALIKYSRDHSFFGYLHGGGWYAVQKCVECGGDLHRPDRHHEWGHLDDCPLVNG